MRIVVVSDRRLSGEALAGALKQVPDIAMVARVDGLDAARSLCQKGETDAVMLDVSILSGNAVGREVSPAALVERGLRRLAGIDAVVGGADEVCYPWQFASARIKELSPREYEVLILLGLGLSNRHIARLLHVTERTVKTHVGRVLAKLGLDSRLQAGLAAIMMLTQRPGRDLASPAVAGQVHERG